MKRIATRAIVEGAMLLGILIILSLISYYVPIFGFITFAILPIPIVFAIFRHSFKVGVMIGVLSFVTLIIVGIDPISATFDSIYGTFTGLALGYGFSKKLKPALTLIITSISILVAGVILLTLASYVLQINVIQEAIDAQMLGIDMAIEFINNNVDSVQAEQFIGQLENFRDQLGDAVQLMLPAVLVMVVFIYGYLNYIISTSVLKKFKIEVEPLPVFVSWRFGHWVIWTFVASVIAQIFIPGVGLIAQNIGQIAMMLITIQGLSVLYFYLSKKIELKPLKVIIAFLIVMALPQMIMMLGMVDFFWNFRRI